MLRRVLASILALLGLVAIGCAIASATVWKPSGTVTTAFKPRPGTAVIVTDPGVLEAPADKVKVKVTVGSGGPVVAAVGRDGDVTAWAAGSTVARITGFATDTTFSSKLSQMPDAAANPSQTSAADQELSAATSLGVAQDSDLWVSSQVVTDSTTLEWQRQAGRWCLVIAPAGTDQAALAKANLDGLTLAVTWPRLVATPWLGLGLVVGAVLVLAAVGVLLAGRRRRGAGGRKTARSVAHGTTAKDSQLGRKTSTGVQSIPESVAPHRPPGRFDVPASPTLAPFDQMAHPADLEQTALVEPIEDSPKPKVGFGQGPRPPWHSVDPTAGLEPDPPDWADTAWPLPPIQSPSAPAPSAGSLGAGPATAIAGPRTGPAVSQQQVPTWPKARRAPFDYHTAEQPAHHTAEQPTHQTAEQPTHQTAEQPAHQTAEQPVYQTAEQVPYQTAEQPSLSRAVADRSSVKPNLAETDRTMAAPPSGPVPAVVYPLQAPSDRFAQSTDRPAPTMADTQVMGLDDIVDAVRHGRLVGLTRRQIRQAEASAQRGRPAQPGPGSDQMAAVADLPAADEPGLNQGLLVPARLTSPTSRLPRPNQPSSEPPAAPPYALGPGLPGPAVNESAAPPTSAASTRARGFLAAIAAGRLSEAEPAPPESTNQTSPVEPWVAPWLHQSGDRESDPASKGVD